MAVIPSPATALRRAAAERYRRMHAERTVVLQPLDSPVVTAPAAGELRRVLLIGNGLVHGWGVVSHQLAPAGELARGLRTLTGSGFVVDLHGNAAMTVASATHWLPPIGGAAYDAAVIAIGSNDALRLLPVAAWRSHLARLVGSVRARLAQDAPILVVGVPDVFVADAVRGLPVGLVPHARRMDAATAALADGCGDVAFLRARKLRALAGAQPDESLYAAFTVPIAAALAERIDLRLAPAAEERIGSSPDEFTDPVVGGIVTAARWEELPELSRMLEGLKLRTRTMEAAVTLLDGEQAWILSADHSVPSAVPRHLSYTAEIVRTGRPLKVDDATRDPRFAAFPVVQVVGLTAFAGAPVRDGDGRIIGALCLYDRAPIELGDSVLAVLESEAAFIWEMVRDTVRRSTAARSTPA